MLAETLQDFAIKHADLIIKKAMKGDELAFSKLMSLWYKRIYNFSFKYFMNHDLAMDITQKTFISVHKNITKLKNESSFKPWLYKIALNKCHEEERRLKRRSWFSIFNTDKEDKDNQYYLDRPAEGTYYNPDEGLHAKELEEIIMDCLLELPEEQKLLIIMKEYEGLKFREIAETLDISENTAKSRLYYGMKAMKKILDKKNIHKENTYYGF